MAVTFSIINNKGGTGKTTTAINLAAYLAKKHKKVLVIDLDSQCNLTSGLGVEVVNEKHIGSVLKKEKTLENCVYELGKLHVVPAVQNLLDYEFLINSEPGREYILAEQLEWIGGYYDFVLLDCPPSLGIMAINSLVAADYFIVPMQAENFAFIGLDRILIATEKVKKRMNPKLELAGILMVRYNQRTKFSQAVVSNLLSNEKLDERVFDSYIRQDISLMEAGAFQQSILDYAPQSRGAFDYSNFANELLRKYGKK